MRTSISRFLLAEAVAIVREKPVAAEAPGWRGAWTVSPSILVFRQADLEENIKQAGGCLGLPLGSFSEAGEGYSIYAVTGNPSGKDLRSLTTRHGKTARPAPERRP